jgi:hypothetical protein
LHAARLRIGRQDENRAKGGGSHQDRTQIG